MRIFDFKKSGGLLASFLVVAAILPVVLIGMLSEDVRLRTFADQQPELRIWIEPEEVVTRPGKNFMEQLYAESNQPDLLIPEARLEFLAEGGLEVQPHTLVLDKPFSGRVKLGEANVQVSEEGELELAISDMSVYTRLPDLKVVTRGVKVLSRH